MAHRGLRYCFRNGHSKNSSPYQKGKVEVG